MKLGEIGRTMTVLGALAFPSLVGNGTAASFNTDSTCQAMAIGAKPEDMDTAQFIGSPLPFVDDRRFGVLVDGQPLVYAPSEGFLPWEDATEDLAAEIAQNCADAVPGITKEKVLKAMERRDRQK